MYTGESKDGGKKGGEEESMAGLASVEDVERALEKRKNFEVSLKIE